jgi:hypothetical protein
MILFTNRIAQVGFAARAPSSPAMRRPLIRNRAPTHTEGGRLPLHDHANGDSCSSLPPPPTAPSSAVIARTKLVKCSGRCFGW